MALEVGSACPIALEHFISLPYSPPLTSARSPPHIFPRLPLLFSLFTRTTDPATPERRRRIAHQSHLRIAFVQINELAWLKGVAATGGDVATPPMHERLTEVVGPGLSEKEEKEPRTAHDLLHCELQGVQETLFQPECEQQLQGEKRKMHS